jgi:hypothetical protein
LKAGCTDETKDESDGKIGDIHTRSAFDERETEERGRRRRIGTVVRRLPTTAIIDKSRRQRKREEANRQIRAVAANAVGKPRHKPTRAKCNGGLF